MTIEEKIFKLMEMKKDEEGLKLYNEILRDILNLDSIFIGLSNKKVVEDDSKRKPGVYEVNNNKIAINLFTRFEYAKAWAKHYNRSIGIVEHGLVDKFKNTFIIAKFLKVEALSINEGSESGVTFPLDAFIEANGLFDDKYLIASTDNLMEDGSLKIDFELIQKLDIEAYEESKKHLN